MFVTRRRRIIDNFNNMYEFGGILENITVFNIYTLVLVGIVGWISTENKIIFNLM